MDFSARLAGLKILARFENTGLGFSARAQLRPGLNPSPCNRQLGFLRICFRSRAEISARGETHHVIGPLEGGGIMQMRSPIFRLARGILLHLCDNVASSSASSYINILWISFVSSCSNRTQTHTQFVIDLH